jgi:hypothetical protein
MRLKEDLELKPHSKAKPNMDKWLCLPEANLSLNRN